MVETPEQAGFLVEMVLPASHVALVTSPASLRRAAKATRRGKFDVILSTAHGDFLESSLRVLAPLGHLIDIGRAGVQNTGGSDPQLLSKNVSYCPVDPSIIPDSDSLLVTSLMHKVHEYYLNGLIGPIPRITTTDVPEISHVLGNISNMVGKQILTFAEKSQFRTVPSAPTVQFNPEACYVITGALGGSGQCLVRWMADRGARHLALLSRRDITTVPTAQKFVESLSRRDIHIDSVVCDINMEQLSGVIQQLASARPIKGIVHAAVCYLDLSFDKLSSLRWNSGLSAKVQGTKNLHNVTLSMPLDFFVMTTSALSVYAFAMQGAYTAANNFQDAFARYRQRLRLPASTASFSLVHEATNVGTDAITVDLFERNKTLTLNESQF
ncbi:hypothetical protein N7537_008664 [Penicillium hordei]|uniref:Ketoreductase domain-containing protein n=1 Tax=Penicillium hordei TaxID=40994 RepID=A0AAD6GYM6_9EURO|nr:uncharacterized protein N7537_008664 [Penicillium hordei]KAJ5598580.1 hypothetical protein N7537_008664 [Penicillium hordei]